VCWKASELSTQHDLALLQQGDLASEQPSNQHNSWQCDHVISFPPAAWLLLSTLDQELWPLASTGL